MARCVHSFVGLLLYPVRPHIRTLLATMGAHIAQELYLMRELMESEVDAGTLEALLDRLHPDCFLALNKLEYGLQGREFHFLLELAVMTETPAPIVCMIWKRSATVEARTAAVMRIVEGYGTRAVVTKLFEECVEEFWGSTHLSSFDSDRIDALANILENACAHEKRVWVWDLLAPIICAFERQLKKKLDETSLQRYIDVKLANNRAVRACFYKHAPHWQMD